MLWVCIPLHNPPSPVKVAADFSLQDTHEKACSESLRVAHKTDRVPDLFQHRLIFISRNNFRHPNVYTFITTVGWTSN